MVENRATTTDMKIISECSYQRRQATTTTAKKDLTNIQRDHSKGNLEDKIKMSRETVRHKIYSTDSHSHIQSVCVV